jgi:intracellular septation protein
MKFLYDLFPVILFFIAFKLADIYVATGVAIGATVLQIGLLAVRGKKIDAMLWVSAAIIVVFGGATLILHDETFIKWKPTVLYWMFAIALAISALLLRKNLIRSMLGKQIRLPDPVWSKLNWSWVAFFVFMGAVNLVIAFNFTTDQWVTYKLFGGSGLMLIFIIAQALFLARHMQAEEKSTQGKP